METKVYDILNMGAVKKEIELPDYLTSEMINKAIKILSKRIEKPYYIEVENPVEKFDLL